MVRALLAMALGFAAIAQGAEPPASTPATAAPVQPGEAPDLPPVRFGIGPFLPAEHLEREFAPLLAHLGRVTGRRFVPVVGTTYDDAIDQAVKGEVDLAYLTPAAYVIARQRRPDLRLLLTDVRGGLDFYTALLVVRIDDRIERVEDLRGRRMVFVDRESTSGYVYPIRFLARLGIAPTQFAELRFSGNHRRSIEMLLNREADVAALSSSLLEGARNDGLDLSDLTVLARAGIIPQHAFCSTGNLAPDVEQRVVEALLVITSLTDEGRKLLPGGLQLNGWRRAVPAEYDDVERTMHGDEPINP
jgi:phosphonate transport system substrate-binding protein